LPENTEIRLQAAGHVRDRAWRASSVYSSDPAVARRPPERCDVGARPPIQEFIMLSQKQVAETRGANLYLLFDVSNDWPLQ
jgi:hypothetical protein